MVRRSAVAIGLALIVIGSAVAKRPAVTGQARALSPDPGKYVDACHNEVDSVGISGDSILVYEGGSPMRHALSRRSGDTAFYAGVIAFLRRPDDRKGTRYFFGYCHRCPDGPWEVGSAMWLELIPSAELAKGLRYRGGSDSGMITCEEVSASEPAADPSDSD